MSLLHRSKYLGTLKYCSLVRLIVYLKYTEEKPSWISRDRPRFSVNHREVIVAKLVLSLTRLSFPLFGRVVPLLDERDRVLRQATCHIVAHRIQKKKNVGSRLFHVLHPCVGFQLFEPGTQRSSKSERRRISVFGQTDLRRLQYSGFRLPQEPRTSVRAGG